jgi:hypothetical protein
VAEVIVKEVVEVIVKEVAVVESKEEVVEGKEVEIFTLLARKSSLNLVKTNYMLPYFVLYEK